MGLSLKSKLFYKFIRHAMKKYVGKEDIYIKNRCPGQTFEVGNMRDSSYTAPKGFKIERGIANGVNYELLKKVQEYSEQKIIYMLHGGAYHMSMSDLYNGVMEKYSNGKFDVFTIDYRTAPKDPYPSALEDAIAGYVFLLECGYSPNNIIMAGDSAGAGLSLAMALKLRELGILIPKTFVLTSPWVDLSEEYTSEQKSGDVLFGWGNVLEMCAQAYANGNSLTDPFISPLYGDFTGFDNVSFYISVAKGEMLESSGVRLANKLRESGACVTLDVLDSGMHAVITMHAIGTKEVKYAWSRINDFISKA